VYGREYNDQVFTLEASGGLINASLIMRDRETDSYWSLMTSKVIAGELNGLAIEELPIGVKSTWKEWFAKYPDTKVLSVNGNEDAPFGYARYFSSEGGFRGLEAVDNRLATKEQIYAFHYNGKPYAVSAEKIEGGIVFQIDKKQLFFFRPNNSAMYQSSVAVEGDSFELVDGVWTEALTGAVLDVKNNRFTSTNGELPNALGGFDTFWYNWSLTNPETELLQP